MSRKRSMQHRALGAAPPSTPPGACPSCGAPRAGAYCAACGERFLGADDLDLKHFLFEQVPHELVHLDGKLPRTLRRLFIEPGALAADHVAGRRQAYVGPLRLYVIAFVLHAFLTFVLADHGTPLPERIRMFDDSGYLARLLDARPDVNWLDPALDERLAERSRWLSEAGTLLIFLLVAAFQKALLYRLHRRYLEHAALALTVGAAYLVLIAAGRLVAAVFWAPQATQADALIQEVVGLTALPLYWFLGIRRFYRLSNAKSALAAIVVTGGHIAVGMALNVAALAILIRTA